MQMATRLPLASTAWNGEHVRTWLASRTQAARLDQIGADKQGYSAQDDYDKAAAEEWVCRALWIAADKDDPAVFADCIRHLLGQDEYPATGIYDDRRFERHVRANLRKLAKMARTGKGFENTLRYQ